MLKVYEVFEVRGKEKILRGQFLSATEARNLYLCYPVAELRETEWTREEWKVLYW